MCHAIPGQRQRGAVLIISIILLVILTLLGLYLSQTGILELRMADNAASRSIAFQNAETARNTAEKIMNALADRMSQNSGVLDCQTEGIGFYAATTTGTNGCQTLNRLGMKWDATDSIQAGNNTNMRYAIEYLGTEKIPKSYFEKEIGTRGNLIEVYVFRILSQGKDAAGGRTLLQSIYTARKT